MTINTYTQGNVRPVCKYLTSTSAVDFLVPKASSKTKFCVHSLIVCNKNASATTITITLTDGTTTWTIYSAVGVTGNTSVVQDMYGLPIPAGWKLRLQAADANRLDVTATISEFSATTVPK